MTNNPKCKDCRFWEKADRLQIVIRDDTVGNCHFNPPNVVLTPGPVAGRMGAMSVLTSSAASNWCSKHERDIVLELMQPPEPPKNAA